MKRFVKLTVLLVALSACQQQQPYLPVYEEGEMRISAEYPGVATKATSSSFEEGDRIGLFVTEYDGETAPPLQISGNWANNIPAVLENGYWSPSKKIFWGEGKMDVYGYYPYMEVLSVDDQPVHVSLDQNASEEGAGLSAYEASDLLWAKAEGVSSVDDNAQVQLSFKHVMSKLVVKLVKGPDYQGVLPDEGELFIHSLVPDGLADLARGEVVKDPYADVAVIKAKRVSADTFEAILIPQRLATRRPFLEYIGNGVSFLHEDTFNFRTGVQYTLNLTINSNPDQVAIEIGGETGGW